MDQESVELSKFSNPEEDAFRELHGNDDIGVTALMYAATQRDATSLLEMLSSGYAEASLFVKDKKGRTALVSCELTYSRIAIKLLINFYYVRIGQESLGMSLLLLSSRKLFKSRCKGNPIFIYFHLNLLFYQNVHLLSEPGRI